MKTMYFIIGNKSEESKNFSQNLSAEKGVKPLNLNKENDALLDAKNAAERGESIIIEEELESSEFRARAIEIAKEFGYLIEGNLFLLDDKEAMDFNAYATLEEGYHRINVYRGGQLIKREMKPLIASSNLGKIAIYAQIFKELGMSYCSLRDLKIGIDVEENGKDELENAMIKAKAYHEATGLPVLCNDSGLVIEKFAPSDQPGVFVRRYGGRELTDEETIEIFSKKLQAVGGESDAYFNVGIALCDKNGVYHSKLFKSYRYMMLPASKTIQKGLPLRSLDYNKQFKKYMSEMTIEEANASEGDCIKAQEEFIKEILG